MYVRVLAWSTESILIEITARGGCVGGRAEEPPRQANQTGLGRDVTSCSGVELITGPQLSGVAVIAMKKEARVGYASACTEYVRVRLCEYGVLIIISTEYGAVTAVKFPVVSIGPCSQWFYLFMGSGVSARTPTAPSTSSWHWRKAKPKDRQQRLSLTRVVVVWGFCSDYSGVRTTL